MDIWHLELLVAKFPKIITCNCDIIKPVICSFSKLCGNPSYCIWTNFFCIFFTVVILIVYDISHIVLMSLVFLTQDPWILACDYSYYQQQLVHHFQYYLSVLNSLHATQFLRVFCSSCIAIPMLILIILFATFIRKIVLV